MLLQARSRRGSSFGLVLVKILMFTSMYAKGGGGAVSDPAANMWIEQAGPDRRMPGACTHDARSLRNAGRIALIDLERCAVPSGRSRRLLEIVL